MTKDEDKKLPMKKCEELYAFYEKHPEATNTEIAEALNWTIRAVGKRKCLLRQRGLIEVTAEGVKTLEPFADADEEIQEPSAKLAAYQHLYDVCIERLETKDMSDSQFVSLVQEIRMILANM